MWAFIRRLLRGQQVPTPLEPPNRLADAVRDILTSGDRFELLSLDPWLGATREAGHFWGWPVLGSTAVDDPGRRAELCAALERGIAESGGGGAACFQPRHGIRASRGTDTVELVICFECAQVYVYDNGGLSGGVSVTDSPEPVFDRILSGAGVPLAPKLDGLGEPPDPAP